jgi:dihydroorotate dehydrogenase
MTKARPWLWIPPQLAHDWSPRFMAWYGRYCREAVPVWKSFKWKGLKFPNPLGIAGGVDKDCLGLEGWWRAGAGFAEVGTITPLPQPGNSGTRVGRDLGQQAVWNRLGFPSEGMDVVAKRLSELPRPHRTPIFANLGKNAVTPLDFAHSDYVLGATRLSKHVDGFVVNISSPNTEGLRELLQPARLKKFLTPLSTHFRQLKQPWLLKMSPDLSTMELEAVLKTSMDLGVDGWILTNTSQGLRDSLKFPEGGGISGKPLAGKSKSVLESTIKILGADRGDKLLVSVGGILTPEDVEERLEMGANLVQVYAALVFSGPFFFRKVAKWQQLRKK